MLSELCVLEGKIILAEKTIVCDIVEQMSGQEVAIVHYLTDIDLSWLGDDPAGCTSHPAALC